MGVWIALLRGINVGGKNILPMKSLRQLLENAGFSDVKTYIQSGNCAFRTDQVEPDKIAQVIAQSIAREFEFCPQVLVIERSQLLEAISANPYPEGQDDPKSVHLLFLAEPATAADIQALENLKAPTERFVLTERVLYLHAPDGIGRSKFAAQAERKLGVVATARNLRSSINIAALLE